MNTIYWISFVANNESLGVVITEAGSSMSALERVTALGQNPGGEAAIVEIPNEPEFLEEVGRYPRDVLIAPDVLLAGGAIRAGDMGEPDPARGPPIRVDMVCDPCNEDVG
jgi:hypothetical protein